MSFSAAQVTLNQDGITVGSENPLSVTLAGGGASGAATSDNQVEQIAILDEILSQIKEETLGKAYAIRLDEVSDTLFYVGKAEVGRLDSGAQWQIVRYTTTGSILKGEYANGSESFDQVWNDRATLTYI